MVQAEEGKFRNLRRWNMGLFALHLIQGILILVITYTVGNDASLPVTASFLQFDPVTQTLVGEPEVLFELPLAPLIAIFFFTSMLDHFLLAWPRYDWYVAGLKEGHNYARWYEYAFSSSIMIVVISMLVGIYDIAALVAIFGINASMNLFGLLMEKVNKYTKRTDWSAYIFGTFAGLIPWVGISIYLVGAGQDGQVPDFVYWIFVSIAVFFFSFAFNMILQYKKVWKWKDYLFGEKAYMVLSLVAKTALAWQVYAGTLAPGT